MNNLSRQIVPVLVLIAASLAGAAYADSSSATPGVTATTGSTAPAGKHCHWHKKGPLRQAMRSAFASCKSAGLTPQACVQQLSTYLADFKPAQ